MSGCVYRRREDVLWRATPRGVMLRAPHSETVTVAAPGDAAWALLAEPLTIDELVAVLADHFEAAPETVRPDVEALIADLEERGVIVGSEPGAP